jgi:hypothetical protein
MSDSNATPATAQSSDPESDSQRNWKETLKKPSSIISIVLGIAVLGLVVWLQQRSISIDLPAPVVTYEILPNEGLTDGLPVAIKLNHVAVFRISDPLSGSGGAERAKEIVANLEGAIADLEEAAGREITLGERDDFPTIIQSASDGSGMRLIVQLTADDLILAGSDSAKGVSRLWAERLTDSLKVMMFAEAPEFTANTEFGEALVAMYMGARSERGAMSGNSLDESFEALEEEQKGVLAQLPPRPELVEGEDETEPAP